MAIKIRKDFHNIISLHEKIIKAIKSQKLRQDQVLESYEENFKQEIEIPSNRFLRISQISKPYMDAVISSKLMDFELIEEYEKYIKDVVTYESAFVITEGQLEDLEYGFDASIEAVLRLEKKLMDARESMTNQLMRIQTHAIEQHRATGDETDDGCCTYCNVQLRDGEDGVCAGCLMMPEEVLHPTDPHEKQLVYDNTQDTAASNAGDTPAESYEGTSIEEEDEEKTDVPPPTKEEKKASERFSKLLQDFEKKYEDGEDGSEI